MGVYRHPVSCLVEIDGESIGQHALSITKVSVKMKRGTSTTATIVLDTFRDERGRWSIQDSDLVHPWDKVVIKALFGPGKGSTEVMRGVIREVRLEYPEDMSAARVTVQVQDDLLRFDREQLHRVLSTKDAPKTDGQIVRELCEKVDYIKDRKHEISDGMRAGALEIETTPSKLLRDRAEANGYELYVRDGALHFHPPRLTTASQDTILVYAGDRTNCIRFDIKHDGHRPDKVRMMRPPEKDESGSAEGDFSTVGQGGGAAKKNTKEKKDRPPLEFEPNQTLLGKNALTSEDYPFPPFVWTIDRPTGAHGSEAAKRAQAKANENQFKIIAKGVLDGVVYGNVLVTHKTVVVDGIGPTYGGKYYVDEVTHQFSTGEYKQEFSLIRNATGQQTGENDGRVSEKAGR